jgi:hypothetical protein
VLHLLLAKLPGIFVFLSRDCASSSCRREHGDDEMLCMLGAGAHACGEGFGRATFMAERRGRPSVAGSPLVAGRLALV